MLEGDYSSSRKQLRLLQTRDPAEPAAVHVRLFSTAQPRRRDRFQRPATHKLDYQAADRLPEPHPGQARHGLINDKADRPDAPGQTTIDWRFHDQGRRDARPRRTPRNLPDYSVGTRPAAREHRRLCGARGAYYFLMGDNRDNSVDSVHRKTDGVGFVPAENLEGKAQIILWSWNKALAVKPWTGSGRTAQPLLQIHSQPPTDHGRRQKNSRAAAIAALERRLGPAFTYPGKCSSAPWNPSSVGDGAKEGQRQRAPGVHRRPGDGHAGANAWQSLSQEQRGRSAPAESLVSRRPEKLVASGVRSGPA